MNDILSRALKTFVQAFFGFLIPEVILILNNIAQYDFANWKTWCLPLICGAISAGISAGWNAILQAQKKEELTDGTDQKG